MREGAPNPLRKGDKVVLWGVLRPGEEEYELQPNRALVQSWVDSSGAEIVHELVDATPPGSPEGRELEKRACVIGREHNAHLIAYGTDEQDFYFLPNRPFRQRRGKNDWK